MAIIKSITRALYYKVFKISEENYDFNGEPTKRFLTERFPNERFLTKRFFTERFFTECFLTERFLHKMFPATKRFLLQNVSCHKTCSATKRFRTKCISISQWKLEATPASRDLFQNPVRITPPLPQYRRE